MWSPPTRGDDDLGGTSDGGGSEVVGDALAQVVQSTCESIILL